MVFYGISFSGSSEGGISTGMELFWGGVLYADGSYGPVVVRWERDASHCGSAEFGVSI